MLWRKVLGKGLRSFQLGRVARRSETLQAGSLKTVYHAQYQRDLGSDDGQVDVMVPGEGQQRIEVIGSDFDILDARFQVRAGIAGRDIHRLDLR